MAPKASAKNGKSKVGKKEAGESKAGGKEGAPKTLIDDTPDPRVLIAPLPPLGFDPYKASATDLATYAYPRKPPEINSTAYAIWSQLVDGPLPLRLLRVLPPSGPDRKGYRLTFSVQNNPGRDETSRNWSGVVTTSPAQHPFTSVFGLWQVPDVDAPPGVSRGTFRCSAWVGLDGHNPTSASMPQIGTSQTVRVRNGVVTKEFEAWSQWWARGATTPVQPFDTFPVDAGDVVAC
ncbi:MAG TPA: G1 family glutamic endopeptidase, partial [Reyranella sp.]|nr:G1 family glutamic endopeptidase [Reyranella sp.]